MLVPVSSYFGASCSFEPFAVPFVGTVHDIVCIDLSNGDTVMQQSKGACLALSWFVGPSCCLLMGQHTPGEPLSCWLTGLCQWGQVQQPLP